MTKDWEYWKDDITQLYKSKTLKEVQESLAAQGFDASIRAYRLKLDEWQIRKNVSSQARKRRRSPEPESDSDQASLQHQKHRSHVSPEHPQLEDGSWGDTSRPFSAVRDESIPMAPECSFPNLPLPDSTTTSRESPFKSHMREAFQNHGCGFVLPERPMEVEELLELISNSAEDLQTWYLFEILVLKWQVDGSYLKVALGHVTNSPITPLLHVHESIFQEFDTNIGQNERNILVKSYLKRVIEAPEFVSENFDNNWLWLLKYTVSLPSWVMRREMLKNGALIKDVAGQSFVECVPSVIAEYSLARPMAHLKEMMDNEALIFVPEEAKCMVRDYMEIMTDFSGAKPDLDLDLSYYKFALRVNKWFQERMATKLESTLEQINKQFNKCQKAYDTWEEKTFRVAKARAEYI